MALNVNEQARKEANLRLLQRTMDGSISDFLGSATHVVLYHFQQSSQSWEKSNVEGSLFLAVRPTGYLLVILNRNSPDNYPIELSRDFQLQQNDPYLIFKNYEDGKEAATIRGIWFPNAVERMLMNDLLTEVLQGLKNKPAAPLAAPPHQVPVAPTPAAAPVDAASATAALLASLNLKPATYATSTNQRSHPSLSTPPTIVPSMTPATAGSVEAPTTPMTARSSSSTSMRQMSPSHHSNQPTLDKKSLQLALLSLIQDERFLDLLHAQYLKVHHARTSRNGGSGSGDSGN